MRIVGTLPNEHHARRFCAYLKRQKIDTSCEMTFDAASGHMSYSIWVHDEDQIGKAADQFAQFTQNPNDATFDVPIVEQLKQEEEIGETPEEDLLVEPKVATPITTFFLALCALIFFWNTLQEIELNQGGFTKESYLITPMQGELLFDIPPPFEQLQTLIKKYELKPGQKVELPSAVQSEIETIAQTPFWRGGYEWLVLKLKNEDPNLALGPVFLKISQGEIWRLFSPAILHTDFLHILFNMIWLWVLGRPIEQRIGPFRTLLLTLAVGIFANVTQYLMSGPFFLGYSGIVMGLAGFIWMREKIAPWEGYPLHRSTILFLVFFVLAMAALQVGSLVLLLFTSVQFTPNIANSAHIAGAILGALLARLPFFAARPIR